MARRNERYYMRAVSDLEKLREQMKGIANKAADVTGDFCEVDMNGRTFPVQDITLGQIDSYVNQLIEGVSRYYNYGVKQNVVVFRNRTDIS